MKIFKSKKSNRVIYIHIEATGMMIDTHKEVNVFYDIPCDMRIRRYRIDGYTMGEVGSMFIELEGFVK